MSVKRVQKLLFSEYCDFEDMVLLESPFAQTTREGKGLRQVHLGLTPSKLVLATDVLPPVEHSCVRFLPGIDPSIETFELIAIYPIDCVNLSVFRRRKRQTIKAHFCNNSVLYYELGGFENRGMFWNLWCEKVKFLCPDAGSSRSESSVDTSSTASTLYVVDSRQVQQPNGLTQIWCKFGTGNQASPTRQWTDRQIFLGKSFDGGDYKPVIAPPHPSQFIRDKKFEKLKSAGFPPNCCKIGDWYPVNRFGSGVQEGCRNPLFLPCDDYIVPKRWSQMTVQSLGDSSLEVQINDLAEKAVSMWETKQNYRHRRRYGFAPQPLFLYGLGPWNITPGAKYSIQVKRAVSVVTIRRQPSEPELRLPVAKRQLIATISCETLHQDKIKVKPQGTCGPRRPVIFFWTPDYWYRPRSARDAYQELQKHLARIQHLHQRTKSKNDTTLKLVERRRFFLRKAPKSPSSDSDSSQNQKRKPRSSMCIFRSRTHHMCDSVDSEKCSEETTLQFLKRVLKVDVVLTAWEFHSTTLAQQLTMIDRDLFLKISGVELGVLICQESSKNAPNVSALVAFSHRISCLVASDILKNETVKNRARLICRFIGTAEKCHKIANFQSCRTILFGLQSPAIYRLQETWAHIRKKHGKKYQTFEMLCKLYRDPRLLRYQKTFYALSRSSPYMPFIGDIFAKIFDKIPDYKIKETKQVLGSKAAYLAQFLLALKNKSRANTKKGLCEHFKPLNRYEDNRFKCLVQTTEFLQQCQLSAIHYSFPADNLAMDYLLKARYKEERDNFYQSLRIE